MASTLLNLSGGFDSVYSLYKYAMENKHLIIHHCNLHTHEGRGDIERVAVHNIMNYIMKQFPNFKYIYVETDFDYGDNHSIFKDKDVIGFMTATLLNNRRYNINKVIISSNKEDIGRPDYYIASENRRKHIIEYCSNRKPDYLYPIEHLTKQEIIEELPKELCELVWYCRKPIVDKICGICKTCKSVIPHLEKRLGRQLIDD